MSRAENVRRIRRAADLADPHLPAGVGFASGWTQRGRDGLNPRGIINHTTEDPRPLSWERLFPILRDGHGAIAGNAISQFAVRRDGQHEGRIVVIAAGLAWHSGAGGWRGLTGNSTVLGTEYHRGVGETVTPKMLEAGLIWDWALCTAFGIPSTHVCEHREWAPGRKVDRRRTDTSLVSGPDWRRDLQRMIDQGGPASAVRTISLGDFGPDVLAWNRTLTELFPYHPASEELQTSRFTAGTAARTLLVLRYGGLSASDPLRPRVGPVTRAAADKMRREPWSGMRVLVKTGGLRYYRRPGWHPENAVAGQHPAGRLFGGAIVNKLTVGAGEQYEVWPRRSDPYLYITASPAHVELV